MSPRFSKVPKRQRDATQMRRLAGTRGSQAVVGEALEAQNGLICWELDPAYSAWFWPFMDKAARLVLLIPEDDLEPVQVDDAIEPPRAPTRSEKGSVLQFSEESTNSVRVYSLVLRGKQPSVHKAFPTRTVSIEALRYCRQQVTQVQVAED